MRFLPIAFIFLTTSSPLFAQQLAANEMSGMKWTKLSEIEPVESEVGHETLGRGEILIEGNIPIVGSRAVRDGIYAHAPSRVVYDLAGKGFMALRGKAALENNNPGIVQFLILGDGKELWKSDVIKQEGNRAARVSDFAVDIAGISKLELVVDDLKSHRYDHSIWIRPELGVK